jgi:hypothetical protein
VFLAVDASAAVELSLEASAPIPVSGQQLPQGQVTGCVDIVGGISIDAGANAQFFGIFDPNVEVNLFNREFDLFQVRLCLVALGRICHTPSADMRRY